MARRRRRLVAITIVLCAASIAYGDFTVTTNPTSAGVGSVGTPMRTVLSIRNTGADPVVAAIGPMPLVACADLVLTDINGMAATQWSFAPGEQRQFVISATYTSPGARTCTWNISAPGVTPAQFTTSFDVDPANQMALNTQPVTFDFAVTGTSETQTGYLQNYALSASSFTTVSIDDGGTNTLAIDGGPCDGMKTCPGAAVSGGSFHTTGFKCTPPSSGQSTGTIRYVVTDAGSGSGSGVRTHAFTCRRSGSAAVIDVMPSPLTIKGASGVPTSQPAFVIATQPDGLQTATIVGTDASAFRITTPAPPCTGTQTCTWSPAQPVGSGSGFSVGVACTPGPTQKTAKLRVRGTAHASDLAETDLACVADSGASTVPSDLDFGDVKVTTTSAPQTFTITNLSSTQATSITVDTGHPDWLVNTCSASPCTLGPGGTQAIEVRFKPSTPAQHDRTLGVFVGGMQVASVLVHGNGTGSRLRVTNQTTPYVLDFGTIGLGATRTREVALKADGNRSLNVALGAPAMPFAISKPAVDLPAGTDGTFDITCRSNTPGTFASMVALTPGPAEHVYAADTPKLDVRCKVANTPIQMSPDELDFGEVRRNTPPPVIEIQLHNPSTSPITLDHVTLADDTALSLSMPSDTVIDPNETITISLTLATTVELTVHSALAVGVGGEELVTPITGKVVTASARVTPTSIKLGSVCVGTQIDEPIKLVNDGTANLRVHPPVMDEPFAVMLVNPVSYPDAGALLSPLEEASAAVRLSTQTPGRVAGKLTWDVDAPQAPFVIDAAVEVKEDGTAVSPQAIGFDQVRVNERSERRTVRLENCGDLATTIQLLGISASRGSPDAWQLLPSRATTALEPGEKLTLEVYFRPKRTGLHRANIELVVDGLRQEIELTGDAIGSDVERTSLYACSCDVPGAPWQGLPLALVVLLVICRRRTGSS